MKRCLLAAVFWFLAFSSGAKAEDVVDRNGVVISEHDIAFYAAKTLEPQAWESGLARRNAILQIIENLYVLRRAQRTADDWQLVTDNYSLWTGDYAQTRLKMEAFLAQAVDRRMAEVDLEVLAKELYLSNPEAFQESEKVSVDHILISKDGRTWEELVGQVSQLAARLSEPDANFNELAREFSDDPSVERNNGSLGYIGKGKTDPAFEAVAFAMEKPGEVSSPVLSSFGIHFIRYNGRMAGDVRTFDQMRLILKERAKKSALADTKQAALSPFRLEIGSVLSDVDEDAIRSSVMSILASEMPTL